MDYQSSYNSPQPGSSSGSPTYVSTASSALSQSLEAPSINYFSTLTDIEKPYISPYAQDDDLNNRGFAGPSQVSETSPANLLSSSEFPRIVEPNVIRSSSSSKASSAYSSPRPTHSPAPLAMNTSRTMSTADREQMLLSLRTHRVNTLTELSRIERVFTSDRSQDVTEAMTTAWAHYVNSNNLLSELRGMTKNYPFSSECLDEAKWQVIGDPTSTRSWNYCWLILTKIRSESLIKKHAHLLALKPAMWGGKNPSSTGVEKLANACIAEWTRAVEAMLRQWSTPPSTSGT